MKFFIFLVFYFKTYFGFPETYNEQTQEIESNADQFLLKSFETVSLVMCLRTCSNIDSCRYVKFLNQVCHLYDPYAEQSEIEAFKRSVFLKNKIIKYLI